MYSALFTICNTIQSYAELTEGCAKFKWSVYLSIVGFLLEPEMLILNMPNSIFQTQTVLAYCWAFWNRSLSWYGHSAKKILPSFPKWWVFIIYTSPHGTNQRKELRSPACPQSKHKSLFFCDPKNTWNELNMKYLYITSLTYTCLRREL